MNFLVTFTNSGTQINKLINANSWSSCLAYCEGTGFDINNIVKLSSNVSVILKDPTSENCYNVNLKSNSSNTNSNNFVFANDFNSLETWLADQTDITVMYIQLTQKSYVTV
jgi:hypothetical protein